MKQFLLGIDKQYSTPLIFFFPKDSVYPLIPLWFFLRQAITGT